MQATPTLKYIDPSLQEIDFRNVEAGFAVPLDDPSPLTSNSDLNQTLDSGQVASAASQPPPVPYNQVWNRHRHEESIRLLDSNSILSEYPFPSVVDCSSSDKTYVDLVPSANSCEPPSKRRGRKRNTQLSEAEKEEKHMKFLERNRLAASKCRVKKKTTTERLEENRRILAQENQSLKGVI